MTQDPATITASDAPMSALVQTFWSLFVESSKACSPMSSPAPNPAPMPTRVQTTRFELDPPLAWGVDERSPVSADTGT